MELRHEGKTIRGGEGRTAGAVAFLTFSRSHVLFFLLCFVYLWLVVEPHLIYHGFGTLLPNAPLFTTGWSFFKDSLSVPGGPVIYASGFLSQGYCHAWLGAAIIVLVGFGLSELTRRHLVGASTWHSRPRLWNSEDHPRGRVGLPNANLSRLGTRCYMLASLPALMLFLIYSQYHHPLSICLAVSLGLLLSLAYEKLPAQPPWIRAVGCCLLAVAGFWFGGAGTWLVFALLTAIYAARTVQMWCLVSALLGLSASAAVAWALAEHVFLIPVHEVWLILTPFAPSATAGLDPFLKVLVFLLYGFVPGVVLLTLAGKMTFGERQATANVPPKRAAKKEKHAPGQRKRLSLAIFAKPALPAVPIVLMALALYASHKELRKPYVLSNYYACQKQWDKILELARRLPKGRHNVFVNHDVIRALYHTGRLPYDLFCYPLVPEALLLTHEKKESDLTQWKLSDIFLELGHVNVAQKLASELLTTQGDLGPVLEELGWINVIKGHPATARVYWEALQRNLVYRRRAESLLDGLDHGLGPEPTAYVEQIRSCMRDDTMAVTTGEAIDETLTALLKRNPRNKMAFEYLMACYLVTNRADKVAENVKRLRDLGYERIPTLYEEAILISNEMAGRPADLAGFHISRETQQRYDAFVQALSAMQTANRGAIFNDLIRNFGTSYFFYYSFGRVGLM